MENKVAGYRKLFGIKQSELAKILGIGKTTVVAREKGSREWTHEEILKVLETFKRFDSKITFEDIFLDNKFSICEPNNKIRN